MAKKSFLHQTNLFLRSCCFSAFFVTTILPYSIFVVLLWPFPLRIRFLSIIFWVHVNLAVLKFFCRIDYKIEGLEHLRKHKKGVVLCKHQSTFETFIMPILFRDPAMIMKRELLWVPCFGWGAAVTRPISINRNDRSSAMDQVITKGTAALKAGRWVVVFPEGTRTAPGTVGKYRLGGARLAVHADVGVLPIAHNAGHFWPRKRFIKQPGTVRIVIGPMIETQHKTPEEVTEEAKQWIEETVKTL